MQYLCLEDCVPLEIALGVCEAHTSTRLLVCQDSVYLDPRLIEAID